MSIEAVPYFLCNSCLVIQAVGPDSPEEIEVRVADPKTGDQYQATYLLCSGCRKKLEKGQRLFTEK